MMFRPRLLAVGLLGLGCAGLVFGLGGWDGAEAQQPEGPKLTPAEGPCLQKPLHWSALPDLAVGVELVLTRYLRFQTPDGRTINARIFLTAFHPQRVKFAEDLPADVLEKRRSVPSRMACIGHEIAADDGYEPDFDVPVDYVKPVGRCAYTVDLGAIECFIRTTARNPD